MTSTSLHSTLRSTALGGIALLAVGLTGCAEGTTTASSTTTSTSTVGTSTPTATETASSIPSVDQSATPTPVDSTSPSTSVSPAASGSATPGASTSASAGAHNSADAMFNQMMIEHHQGAIDMSKLAATNAASPEVKALATRIEKAQAPEITRMTEWLKARNEPLSSGHGSHGMPGMDMGGKTQEQVMAQLKGLKGAAFDKAFLTNMIAHHEGALVMAKDVAAKGQDATTKQLAQQIETAQQPEIDEMKKMLANL